jgi:hypothetical protein
MSYSLYDMKDPGWSISEEELLKNLEWLSIKQIASLHGRTPECIDIRVHKLIVKMFKEKVPFDVILKKTRISRAKLLKKIEDYNLCTRLFGSPEQIYTG